MKEVPCVMRLVNLCLQAVHTFLDSSTVSHPEQICYEIAGGACLLRVASYNEESF